MTTLLYLPLPPRISFSQLQFEGSASLSHAAATLIGLDERIRSFLHDLRELGRMIITQDIDHGGH